VFYVLRNVWNVLRECVLPVSTRRSESAPHIKHIPDRPVYTHITTSPQQITHTPSTFPQLIEHVPSHFLNTSPHIPCRPVYTHLATHIQNSSSQSIYTPTATLKKTQNQHNIHTKFSFTQYIHTYCHSRKGSQNQHHIHTKFPIAQYIHTYCKILQHTLQHAATRCDIWLCRTYLQHTATRCNTLQYI